MKITAEVKFLKPEVNALYFNVPNVSTIYKIKTGTNVLVINVVNMLGMLTILCTDRG